MSFKIDNPCKTKEKIFQTIIIHPEYQTIKSCSEPSKKYE
jgi:hypothetical protein